MALALQVKSQMTPFLEEVDHLKQFTTITLNEACELLASVLP